SGLVQRINQQVGVALDASDVPAEVFAEIAATKIYQIAKNEPGNHIFLSLIDAPVELRRERIGEALGLLAKIEARFPKGIPVDAPRRHGLWSPSWNHASCRYILSMMRTSSTLGETVAEATRIAHSSYARSTDYGREILAKVTALGAQAPEIAFTSLDGAVVGP